MRGELSAGPFPGAFKKIFLEGLQRSADQARVMSRMRNPREWSRFVLSVCPFVLCVLCLSCWFNLPLQFRKRKRVGLEVEARSAFSEDSPEDTCQSSVLFAFGFRGCSTLVWFDG